jgi:CBS domain-containing protein
MDIMDAKVIGDSHEFLLVEPAKVKKGMQVHEAMRVLLDNPYTRKIYVVDDDGKLLGAISYLNMLRASGARYKIRKEGFWPFVRYLKDMFMDDVTELMKDEIPIKKDQTLREAVKIMLETGQTDIPVVDDSGVLLGELRGMEIMRLTLEAVKKGDDLAMERLKQIREEKGIKRPIDPVTLKPK